MVRDGELVAQGSEAELQERLGVGTGIELEIAGPVEAVAAALRAVPGVRAVTVQPVAGGRSLLRVDAPDALRPALAEAALSAGARLFRLDVSADRLESLFLKLAGRGAAA